MNHLEEGSLAPDFELQTPEGTLLKLSEAIRFGPIAVVFYKSECATSQFYVSFHPENLQWNYGKFETRNLGNFPGRRR